MEQSSSVEVVVVVGQSSGSYREIDHQNGFVLAMLSLMVAVHSPWEFSEDLIIFWLVVIYAAVRLISSRWDPPRRWLTSAARRRDQVQKQARAAFVERRVSSTRDRSGLLLYLSYFERLGIFVPDTGVEAQVPRALLNDLEARWAKAKTLPEFEAEVLKGLDSLVKPLASGLPRREDDTNELSNEVIVEVGR